MTREEVRKMLGEAATEEQITNALNMFHQKEQELKKTKESLNQYSDYDDLKTKLEQIERERMTEEEKLQLERQEIAENLRQSRIIKNTAKAKEVLAGLGIDETLIGALVVEDETVTLDNVNKLAASINTTRELTAKEVEEKLSSVNLEPTVSNKAQDSDVMTLDKFAQMSAAEQSAWQTANPEEFATLS